MKRNFNMIHAAKRAPLWTLVLLAGLFFVGCTKDINSSPSVTPPAGDKASVVFTVNTPKPTLPDSRSRMSAITESAISEVKVLAFETGQDNTFLYVSSGSEVVSAGDTKTKFKVSIPETANSLKLVIIANANDALASLLIDKGTPESSVREMVNAIFTSSGQKGSLPMYGEIELPDGVSASQTYNLTATMLRAVARVDVVKDLMPSSEEFVLEQVYVFRANDAIQLMPNVLTDGSIPKVDSPSVPSSAHALANPVLQSLNEGSDFIGHIYIPESAKVESNEDKVHVATTVVIGGRFGGSGNGLSYYRADFNSGLEGPPFGQVLRNHRYIFKIKSVSSEGWPSPEEAATNLASSILVDVQAWEDFSSEMYLGDDRLGLSSRDISLRYVRNRHKEIDVESTLEYTIQWLDAAGLPTGAATSIPDHVISNSNFDVRIVRRENDKPNVSHLVFTTLNDNHVGETISDALRVKAGKWSIDITVRQDNSAMYSNRYLSVLSVEGVGNLGVNMLAPDASGLAMRRVLDNQFGPGGKIRIGGPSFTRILNNDNWTNTSATNNLFIIKRLFGTQDVIYFPHAVNVSTAMANLLVEWLEENPRRVLIIGMDSDASNKNLRLNAKFSVDGSWSFNPVAVTGSFARATESPQNIEFFDGPFGVVSPTAQFRRADDTAGYTRNRSENVTPLITANKEGYTDAMFFGVNKTNRVIYHGDAQLFQTQQMSNDNGEVRSDLDILFANTWAWIVEQVIYGLD